MTRARLFRLLLAAVLAFATSVHGAQAQFRNEPPPTSNPSDPHRNNVLWFVVGGIALGVIGLFMGKRLFPDPTPGDQPPPNRPFDPPPVTQISVDPASQPSQTTRQSKTRKGTTGQPKTGQLARNGFNLPPPGETRFVPNEVMLDIPASVPTRTLDLIAARHSMTRLETQSFRLTGRTLHRWRLDGGGTVADMIRGLAGETQVAGAQPLYLFAMAEAAPALPQMNSDQYAPEKLSLAEAHRLATGNRVLVALIDSGVDAAHPDLAGAVSESFDAAADGPEPHPHGTGMAGAIAARRTVLSSAPRVGLLAIRAFSTKAHNAEATTFNIIKGLDWAAERGARIVNMSFAGPADPRLRDALAKASRKGIVLIAAAGNSGPQAPPQYPAADPNVIAVTATDMNDAIYPGAVRGGHIAVAAPGVDIFVPAPAGTYQFTTGTSVAAAEVSGVAALLIERNPALKPAEVRRILMRTARSLGPKDRERDFGAGLVNAYQAVSSSGGRIVERAPSR
jgi:subtilisin family serine protease